MNAHSHALDRYFFEILLQICAWRLAGDFFEGKIEGGFGIKADTGGNIEDRSFGVLDQKARCLARPGFIDEVEKLL
ncbi:MAG: hypothetical protein RLN85_22210, partial [Pseudomonadales bacterium]